MISTNAALLLIDLQVAIFTGRGGRDQAAADARLDTLCARLRFLGTCWAATGRPILAVQHLGPPGHRLEAGTPGGALRPEIAGLPLAATVRKTHCDSFCETGLGAALAELGVDHLVVGGCMTDFCVDTTCRNALSNAYGVTLLADGHETVDSVIPADLIRQHHNAALDGLTAAGVELRVEACSTILLALDQGLGAVAGISA